MTEKEQVLVDGHIVQLSNLDKVLWPNLRLTKADLLAYYARLQPVVLPHWEGRFLTVTRYPKGVEESFFYQKNLPTGAPEWIQSAMRRDTNYIVAHHFSSLVWLANSNAIEFHPSLDLVEQRGVPSYAVIDLDPTPPLGFAETVHIAKCCRELLHNLNLVGYPKLSGATGLHIYIPLEAKYNFSLAQKLVLLIAETLQKALPQLVTLERLVKNRRGIYIDYLQNHEEKTIVGVYSPRPTPRATVSTPITWGDLDYYGPEDFTIQTVPQWVEEKGDLFRPVINNPQGLEHLLQYF